MPLKCGFDQSHSVRLNLEAPSVIIGWSISYLRSVICLKKLHLFSGFICTTCNAQFSRFAHLREHEATHIPLEERRIFVCTHCSLRKVTKNNDDAGAASSEVPVSAAFASKRSLQAHIRAVHANNIRRYPCTHTDCPAILSTKVKPFDFCPNSCLRCCKLWVWLVFCQTRTLDLYHSIRAFSRETDFTRVSP